jgi:hypothetical protein
MVFVSDFFTGISESPLNSIPEWLVPQEKEERIITFTDFVEPRHSRPIEMLLETLDIFLNFPWNPPCFTDR